MSRQTSWVVPRSLRIKSGSETTLIRLYVRLSVRPSLNFLKTGSLVFSNTLQGDSWPWHLVTDGARCFNKSWIINKSGTKWVFLSFYWVWFILFSLKLHETIVCNNAYHLKQEKLTQKKLGPKFRSNGSKSGPRLGVFFILSNLVD